MMRVKINNFIFNFNIQQSSATESELDIFFRNFVSQPFNILWLKKLQEMCAVKVVFVGKPCN